ncbi:40079_t:CDS:2, partial [Gigaspora margarita]
MAKPYKKNKDFTINVNNNSKFRSRVPLKDGNLVLNSPVPDGVLKDAKITGDEFEQIRYTAITCDPDNFKNEKYLIRQYIDKRETEILIVITLYNEDVHLFIKTMSSVIKNVSYLCSKERSSIWESDGWKKVVVLIMSDGRNKINDEILKVLGVMGIYQGGIIQTHVRKKPAIAHLFEYTTQINIDNNFHTQSDSPVQ